MSALERIAAIARVQPGQPRGALSWSLAAATVIAFGTTVLLATTRLSETPNTYCGRVINPEGGETACGDIYIRRLQWVIVAAAVTVVLGAMAYSIRVRGWDKPRPSALVSAVLAAAVVAGIVAAGRVTIGDESCGSTLSRVDEYGEYNPGKPAVCEPRYDQARAEAWGLGAFAVFGLLMVPVGAAITVTSAHQPRRRQRPQQPPSAPKPARSRPARARRLQRPNWQPPERSEPSQEPQEAPPEPREPGLGG